ncbi:MAG: beta-L-arabinofuranosidase domain-containing protein, partial [Fimbriimonadales bacterium]
MALRPHILLGAAPLLLAMGFGLSRQASERTNLAPVAESSTSYVSPHEKLSALNDGYEPRGSWDRGPAAYGNWPRRGTQWVEYRWPKPISTDRIEVYWFDDRGGVRLPSSCRLLAWTGGEWHPVQGAESVGLLGDRFNVVEFPAVRTDRLRLEFASSGEASTGILEWRVIDAGDSPNFAPRVEAGPERTVVLGGRTYLTPQTLDDGKPSRSLKVRWSQASGPGKASFADAASAETSATFDRPGVHVLRLTADDGEEAASDTVRVRVVPAPSGPWLQRVKAASWSVGGPFWGPRFRAIVTKWIPYLIAKLEDPALPEGGLWNFDQAAKRLKGLSHGPHRGYPFADAYAYDTLEAMSLALFLDAAGDPEIARAQALFRRTIARWVPRIVAAQHPDGYLQTFETIRGLPRWSNVHNHEAFNLGHLLEAAMAHFEATGRKDRRLLDAAIRAADCWDRNLGPAPKRPFHVEHQGLEQALVRLGRLV